MKFDYVPLSYSQRGHSTSAGHTRDKIKAKNSSKSMRKATEEAAQGLQRYDSLVQRAKAMPMRIHWSHVGLFNGTQGELVDFVFAPGQKAPILKEFVVVQLEEYTGPAWSLDLGYEGCARRFGIYNL